MSDEKKYTEREMILARREAFVRGYRFEDFVHDAETESEKVYPLPKARRLRVVQDVERYWEFRVVKGKVQCRWNGGGGFNAEWGPINRTVEAIEVTRTRCDIWADLLANPTEEVDA